MKSQVYQVLFVNRMEHKIFHVGYFKTLEDAKDCLKRVYNALGGEHRVGYVWSFDLFENEWDGAFNIKNELSIDFVEGCDSE